LVGEITHHWVGEPTQSASQAISRRRDALSMSLQYKHLRNWFGAVERGMKSA